MMRIISVVLNSIIFLDMLILTVMMFYRDGKWSVENGTNALKYYTFLSNVFCALTALGMVIFPNFLPAWILKYTGTVAVTITFLTVLFFLGPVLGYKRVLTGRDFVMHLVNPILALVSLCVFERNEMPFYVTVFGLLQMILYGLLYGYKVMFAKGKKGWDDFYGFNKGGRWYISAVIMLLGTFAICVILWFICRL